MPEPERLVLNLLRRIDEKTDRLADDMHEVKSYLGMLEGQYASMSNCLDRLDRRVERLERRMDLSPGTVPRASPPDVIA
jgi:hypothetical protein